MASKQVHGTPSRAAKWKTRLGMTIVAVAILAACAAIRYGWGPDSARAQTARKFKSRPAQPNSSTRSARKRKTSPRAAKTATPTRRASNSTQLKVVANVNGQQISRQHLARECLRRFGEEALESMVNKQLIQQECQRRGIVITTKQLDDEIGKIAKKFRLTVGDWLNMLQSERDLTLDQYRRDIIWPTLALRRLAVKQLIVTNEELSKAWESDYGPKVQVRLISVSSAQKAKQLHAQAVAKPEQFGKLAKQYSEDASSASALGLIPPIRKHLGEPEVEKAAFALKEGGISPVVHAANQYLILQCVKHLPSTSINPKSRKEVQQRLRDRVRTKKMRSVASKIFKQLQEQTNIVNVYNDEKLSQKMPGIAATINGKRITIRQLSEECISRHGEDVLQGEINRMLLSSELRRRKRTVSDDDLDREIARAAESYGVVKADGSPDIEAWLEKVVEEDGASVDLYVRDVVWPTAALKNLVGDSVNITQEDLRKAYDANYGERVEVLVIVLGSQRLAHQVWDMARSNPTDEYYGKLAGQYSIEQISKANLGKVPPIRRHSGQPVIEKEAFSLETGELSGVLVLGDKYVILRCLGHSKTVAPPAFEEVRDDLTEDIHEKKLRIAMANQFDRLKEGAQIDNFLTGTRQRARQTGTRPTTTRRGGTPTIRRTSATESLRTTRPVRSKTAR